MDDIDAAGRSAVSFVPAVRLGALLHRERVRAGRSLADLCIADDRFTPARLVEIERGVAPDETELAPLVAAYGLPPFAIGPARPRVVLDRSTAIERPGLDVGSGSPALIDSQRRLIRLQVWWPGLLDDDANRDAAEDYFGEPPVWDLEAEATDPARQLCIPAAGLLIGENHTGTLILVLPGGSVTPAVVTVDPVLDVGTLVSVLVPVGSPVC